MINNSYKTIKDMVIKTEMYFKLNKDGFFNVSNLDLNTNIKDLMKGHLGTFYDDESKTKRALYVVKE